MTHYAKQANEEPSITELIELSLIYQRLLNDLADLFGITLTPTLRARAFEIIKEMGEELKMKTLSTVVLAEVRRPDEDQNLHSKS